MRKIFPINKTKIIKYFSANAKWFPDSIFFL